MNVSAEATALYEKSNALWKAKGFPIRFSDNEDNERVDFGVAKKAIGQFIYKETGSKLSRLAREVRETSGNRYTWIESKRLSINTAAGWPNIVHLMGHWLAYHKGIDKPHCAEHAVIELRFTKFILDGGFVEQSREAIAKPKIKRQRDVVQDRYAAMLKRKANWSAKLKRAENAHKKVLKEIRDYERRHGDRLL